MSRFSRTIGVVVFALTLGTLGGSGVASAEPAAQAASPDADDLIHGARILDGRAASLEAHADASLESAKRNVTRAEDLRGDATRQPGRAAHLRAQAEELEVRAVSLRAQASRERESAKQLRTKASELRTRAKQAALRAPTSKKGRLDVTARTPCQLEVDGVPRGVAPIVGLALAEGTHDVTCRADGIPTRTRKIEIVDGRSSRLTFEDQARPSTNESF
jgi:hypothetical protein